MSVEGLQRICPNCGQDNNCQHGQGGCWCETVKVSRHLLELVPEDKMGKVCICKSCIEKFMNK
ncbi:cysteine-rich CWC family protein [Bacillus sp. RG28]|uniref:Cysteine-rich CWC family protein n=1 Tax=Gottfriedia endophytica TaxID=2820819 RepID=A0A940NUZ3_9BACI|nr:cysteine-rich CWC family protein [Gottfriedia endophytica]